MKRQRIDKLLVDQKLVTTRARAQAMILAGHVLVDDVPVTKAGELVAESSIIRLREPELKYVSRGAIKLKAALENFQLDVTGKVALDVGASTGGFTEILLEFGAAKVIAIDVGTNQLAWRIRSDPRVEVRENLNARYLRGQVDVADLAVMDVSFISIRLIIPSLMEVLRPQSVMVILFKPQFEVGKELVGPGGIVKDQVAAKMSLNQTLDWAKSQGLEVLGQMESPILGTDGNHEYLIYLRKIN